MFDSRECGSIMGSPVEVTLHRLASAVWLFAKSIPVFGRSVSRASSAGVTSAVGPMLVPLVETGRNLPA